MIEKLWRSYLSHCSTWIKYIFIPGYLLPEKALYSREGGTLNRDLARFGGRQARISRGAGDPARAGIAPLPALACPQRRRYSRRDPRGFLATAPRPQSQNHPRTRSLHFHGGASCRPTALAGIGTSEDVRELGEVLSELRAVTEMDPALEVIAQQCVERLDRALLQLSPKAQATFLLYRRDGKSMDEISNISESHAPWPRSTWSRRWCTSANS